MSEISTADMVEYCTDIIHDGGYNTQVPMWEAIRAALLERDALKAEVENAKRGREHWEGLWKQAKRELNEAKAEVERLREQLRLANIDQFNAEAEVAEWRDKAMRRVTREWVEDLAGAGADVCNSLITIDEFITQLRAIGVAVADEEGK